MMVDDLSERLGRVVDRGDELVDCGEGVDELLLDVVFGLEGLELVEVCGDAGKAVNRAAEEEAVGVVAQNLAQLLHAAQDLGLVVLEQNADRAFEELLQLCIRLVVQVDQAVAEVGSAPRVAELVHDFKELGVRARLDDEDGFRPANRLAVAVVQILLAEGELPWGAASRQVVLVFLLLSVFARIRSHARFIKRDRVWVLRLVPLFVAEIDNGVGFRLLDAGLWDCVLDRFDNRFEAFGFGDVTFGCFQDCSVCGAL